jgi:hypothetical protein
LLRGGVLVTAGQPVSEQTTALALANERFTVDLSSSLADAIRVPIGGGASV